MLMPVITPGGESLQIALLYAPTGLAGVGVVWCVTHGPSVVIVQTHGGPETAKKTPIVPPKEHGKLAKYWHGLTFSRTPDTVPPEQADPARETTVALNVYELASPEGQHPQQHPSPEPFDLRESPLVVARYRSPVDFRRVPPAAIIS